MAINKEKFANLRQLGNGGWNTLDDPQDVKDSQLTDVLNMTFERGYPRPRKGSLLKWDKPSGETNDPTCLFQARTSDGIQYIIAVYAPNFYLRDETNSQWIKINQTYTPSTTYKSLMYSYINWNAGKGSDKLYACNGTESFVMWNICLSTFANAYVAADTSVTLTDASYFPASGTLVFVTGGNTYTAAYSSKAGNVLTLTTNLGQNVSALDSVTCMLVEKSGMPKGIALTRHQRRLFVANGSGTETTMKYSVTEDPETFTTGTGPTAGGALVITDGNGAITRLTDFGDFVLVSKTDSHHRFNLIISQDLSAKLDQINPVASSASVGPTYPWMMTKKNNNIFFPTETEGITSMNPDSTGTVTSIDVIVLSKMIQNYVTTLTFDSSCRSTSFNQKILFTAKTSSQAQKNDVVLVYDLIRENWTRWNNLSVQDFVIYNKELLFVSYSDGKVYKMFYPFRTDNSSPFSAYIKTKNYDFGQPSLPKTETFAYVQGYISEITNLYVDVLYNEQGSQGLVTYQISGQGRYVSQVASEALGTLLGGIQIMGTGITVDDSTEDLRPFRVYLNLPNRFGYYVLSFRFYTTQDSADWTVTGLSLNPDLNDRVPPEFALDPVTS